ncbi:MAG: TonB-dependent receptor [Hyphomonadaceae bacterium]
MTQRLLLTGSAALMALAIAMPGASFAQAASDTEADRSKVETIIVTARKTQESLISTPVAVTAVGASDVSRLNIQAIDDLARFTPGLSFSKAFGRATDRPVVRGAASILAGTQPGVEAGTAYFVDGVYYQGDISSIDLADVARVEVIKGPQSALYGRNTYSGAINFITNSPGTSLKAGATLSIGTHNEQSANLRLAGPITSWLSGGLAARYYTYDGEWGNSAARDDNPLGSEQTKSVSGVLEARPVQGLTLRARVVHAEDEDGPRAFGFQASSKNNCYPGYRSNAYRGAAATTDNNPNQWFCGVIKDTGVYFQNTGGGGTRPAAPFLGVERDLTFGSLIADVDLPNDYTVNVSYGFRDETLKTGSDSDFLNGASFPQTLGANGIMASNSLFGSSGSTESKDMSLEVKLSSPQDKRVRWMLGLYGYSLDQTGFSIDFAADAGATATPVNGVIMTQKNLTNSTSNGAIFGRLGFDITDTLSIDLEARQQAEKRSTQNFCAAVRSNPTIAPTCTGFVGGSNVAGVAVGGLTYDDTRNFDSFTPRATLTWKPNENQTIYAIYAEGTKPGGLNGTLGIANGFPQFDPETSTNYEIGYKARLFDGRGTLALSAYDTKADKMQLTTAVSGSSGVLTSIVTNQGNAEIKGFEADFRFRVTDNLGFSLNYSHISSEFTEGCDEFQYTLTSGGYQIGTTCTSTRRVAGSPNPPALPNGSVVPLPGANGSIVGAKIPLVPADQASFNIDYSRQLGANLELFASADLSYEGTKYIQVHGGAETGETTLVGGRVGVSGERWKLSLWGKNLTDEDSIPIATRWFDVFQGSAAAAGLTGAAASGIDTGSPRAFFFMPRRGRSVGLELKVNY